MILHAFGDLDIAPWYKLLVKFYPNYTFSIGKEIPTSPEFRISTIVERRSKSSKGSSNLSNPSTSGESKRMKRINCKTRVPTFSPDRILEHLESSITTTKKGGASGGSREEKVSADKKDIHLVLTRHLLVEDKSITSTLYAGLCWSAERLMIVSFARLSNDEVIATVIHHEIGHMLGLPHCEDDKCIMRAGQHGVDVVASTFWCQQCLRGL